MALDETWMGLGISLIILAGGFALAHIITRILVIIYRARRKIVKLDVDRKLKAVRYFIMTLTIIAALAYLKSGAVSDMLTTALSYLPDIFTAILLLILGIITVNFITNLIEWVLLTIGIVDYAGAYEKKQTLKVIMFVMKLFLYVVIIELVMSILGFQSSALNAIIRVVVYSAFVIIALLAFFGFRGIIENAVAGLYIKGVGNFKPGSRIVVNGEAGEITSVSNIDTTINTDSGYLLRIPNKEFLKKEVKFEKIKAELHALEEIKNHFVEQRPSHCGPACAQMVLSIFGHKGIDQDKIASMSGTEVGKGTHPEMLKQAIEEVTDGKVLGHWIPVNKIMDLKQELKSWLYDGALVIVDFKKKVVFPTIENDKAHYAICVGIEGDDMIILDPSGPKGGVYLANHQDVHRGMNTFSKLINGKRGYLVLAPRGTPAYWRLKKGLVYADKDLYAELSKGLEEKMEKLVNKSAFLKNVVPDSIRAYMKEWEERYKIGRLWRPDLKK
ncbi:mechanosensitive ion channel [Candidatus Woesearchaeota archaeon]|nr:mechanosensitive ion channel [Candidatus Woesearchaeota archaeon]